ncbi:MAG TPA: hypothetical protein VNO33_19415, partial [Kofleriaceae bacterium]|nr:hypothetical protein [Kofleriaceae bacterium]
MTGTALLTPERETELAKEIEAREIEIWTTLLGYPAAADHVLKRIEALLDNALPEFRALRRAATKAKKVRTKAAQTALETVGRRIGAKLLSLDVDRRVIESVMGDVRR